MKSKDLEKIAKKAGLQLIRSRGSHRVYGKPGCPILTIPVKNSKDMNPNTYRGIVRQISNYG